MSKKLKKPKKVSKKPYTLIKEYNGITEYRLQNGLTVLHKQIEGTGVITTNITYNVGARDESVGQTGIAHMLEHMLFKQTLTDKQKKIDSSAMQFERETGCILNANTWKDRTTYFFSYPKEHFVRALQIEAERMHGVLLTDEEFTPERGNVLSEFDMYFGDPNFALSMEMISSAYHSHPYGHETIGFRQDIERYTTEDLKLFYNTYYDPLNATLMVIGDIDKKSALTEISQRFGTLKTAGKKPMRTIAVEPLQEGIRRIEIERASSTNIVAFGVKHEGFPSKKWFESMLVSSMLADGPDSILYKKLVDTGLASKVEMSVEPAREENLAILFVTLSKKATHAQIEKIVFEIVSNLDAKSLEKHYKKIQQKIITSEIIERQSSLRIAMELTEYVSVDSWEKFFETESILKGITVKDIVTQANIMFNKKQMTIGYFIGKK